MDEHEKLINLVKKHPNHVPVILHPTVNFERQCKLIKKKFLVNSQNTVGIFLWNVKITNKLNTTKGLYLFYNQTLLSSNENFQQLRTKFPYDVVLNITIDCENVFG
jgi:hypothetical protein